MSLPALGAGTAVAASATLYVNKLNGNCSDAGTGTLEQPYCTVSAAAAKVEPGQTVLIGAGEYRESVTLTRSGTVEAPITFIGAGGPGAGYRAPQTEIGFWRFEGMPPAFTLSGVSHVRISGVELLGYHESVVIDGGTEVNLSGNLLTGLIGEDPRVRVTGAARNVTLARNASGERSGLVVLEPGVRDTVVSTNLIAAGGHPGIVADGAPGTVIVANTVDSHCEAAIRLTGASTGATVMNNVLTDSTDSTGSTCTDPGQRAGLWVDQEAKAGARVAYNLHDSGAGLPAYSWAGTVYDEVAQFAAASGQGAHDVIGAPNLPGSVGDTGERTSPAIDSADESAPGMSAVDVRGSSALDDPWVADTGTGSGRRDRGAEELVNFGSRYTPVGPVRVLDTREATGVPARVPVAPGATMDLPVTGLNGLPADGVTAVTMNVTVTESTGGGFLTVYPHGAERPTASNLNWTAGQTIPNLVTTQVRDGKVSFFNGSGGTVHVLADLLGFYSTKGSGFTAKSPVRLLDTREGLGAAKAPVRQGGTVDLQVTGANGVPATGVTAVTLNVTVADATDGGFLTAYPHGEQRPTASSLNWVKGQVVPNLVTVPVKDGKVSLFVAGSGPGQVQLIADLAGCYTKTGGDQFHALVPVRKADTRGSLPWYDEWEPGETVRGGATRSVEVVEYPGASAVAMNVTVTGTAAPGFLTVYPDATERPVVSNLNWVTGQTVPNHVVVATGAGGKNAFYNGSQGDVELIADLFGYFAPA